MGITQKEFDALPAGLQNALHKIERAVGDVLIAHGRLGHSEDTDEVKQASFEELEKAYAWLRASFR